LNAIVANLGAFDVVFCAWSFRRVFWCSEEILPETVVLICCEKQSRDGSTAVSSPDAGCYQGDTIQISPFASQSIIILSLQQLLVLLK
jgi:hypothetical protein